MRRVLRSCRSGVLIAGCLTGLDAPPAFAQAPTPLRTIGLEIDLHRIRDVAVDGDRLVVLTAPAPALHLSSSEGMRQWGREGRGPGELENPIEVLFRNGDVVVLDALPGDTRVTRYTPTGEVDSTWTLPVTVATDIAYVRDRLFVRTGGFGSDRVQILRLTQRVDTFVSYPKRRTVKLHADAGPTRAFSAFLPFQAVPQWSAASGDELIAFWNGSRDWIGLYDPNGRLIERLPLPAQRIAVGAQDRDAWYYEEFPRGFLGRNDDPLREIREEAREVMAFPTHFPPVLDLLPDPHRGVWVKRAPASQGEIWLLLGGRAPERVRLPIGREVKAFGADVIAAIARDETDVELVELYARESLRN